MTEIEWLACDMPHWMLQHLRPWKRRHRKICLYVCASYRRLATKDHLPDPCLILLDAAERFADGLAGPAEYKTAKQAVSKMTRRDKRIGGENGPPLYGHYLLSALRFKHLPGWEGKAPVAERVNYLSDEMKRNREARRAMHAAVATEDQAVEIQKNYDAFMQDHTDFIRDIFGNPFRSQTINPNWLAWNRGTVPKIAQAIYDDRAFDELPDLADALEVAGCDNTDVLMHLRGPGPHVRGCWALDMLLGKE
jgi:hypothetical protein